MSTTRQRKLAEVIVANATTNTSKSAGEMLREAGYSQTVSEKKPAEIMERVGVKRAIREVLAEAGVTEEMLAAKHRELLEARDSHGKPDNGVQARVLELGYKLYGYFEPEKPQPCSAGVNIAVLCALDKSFGEQGTDVTETKQARNVTPRANETAAAEPAQ